MKNYTNEVCKKCAKEKKFTCCNSVSGGFSPRQLGLEKNKNLENESKIVTLLNSGIVTINDSSIRRPPFIKPRNFSEFELFRNSIVRYTIDTDRLDWFPEMKIMDCIFLGANGCILTEELRPYQCIHKLAKPKYDCPLEQEIYTISDLWEPYEKLLRSIIDKIKNGTIKIEPLRVAANYVGLQIKEENECTDEDEEFLNDLRRQYLLGYSDLNLDEVKKLITCE